jgi:hypothetical protein
LTKEQETRVSNTSTVGQGTVVQANVFAA